MAAQRQISRTGLAVGQFVLLSVGALDSQQRQAAERSARQNGHGEYVAHGHAVSEQSGALFGAPRVRALSLDEQLDAKYAEIDELYAQGAQGNLTLIFQAVRDLSSLQASQARAIGDRYEASFSRPLDAGRALVKEARDLYAKYAHLAGADAPARDPGDEKA